MRIKPLRFGHGAKPAATDLAHPHGGQTPTRQRVQIGEPLARHLAGSKAGSRAGIVRNKRLKHLVANFERLRPDGGTQPGHQRVVVAGQVSKCGHSLFDHAGSQSAPSRMRRTDAAPRAVCEQHR